MGGESDLNILLSLVTAKLDEGVYVFVTLRDRVVPEGLRPRMLFEEAEGTTLIITKAQAEAEGLDYEFVSRMLTLDVHSALDAVGFIARVARELADAGVSINPIAGFYHDHIFVPDGDEQKAMQVIADLPNKV